MGVRRDRGGTACARGRSLAHGDRTRLRRWGRGKDIGPDVRGLLRCGQQRYGGRRSERVRASPHLLHLRRRAERGFCRSLPAGDEHPRRLQDPGEDRAIRQRCAHQVDPVGARYFVRAFPDTLGRGRSKFLGIPLSSEKPSDPTEIRQHQGYRDRFQRHDRPAEKSLLPLHVWKRKRHEIRCWRGEKGLPFARSEARRRTDHRDLRGLGNPGRRGPVHRPGICRI